MDIGYIRRKPKPVNNFYILDKDISEDRALSWGARGLLIFLLGKQDTWKTVISNLIGQTSDSAKPSRRDAVYGYVKELIDVGYMRKIPLRDQLGTFIGVGYEVDEDKSRADNPLTDLPETAEPDTAKRTLVSTDSLPSTEKPIINQPSVTKGKGKKGNISVEQWQEQTADELIPDGHACRVTAKKIGLPDYFVDLALDEMIDRNTGQGPKYKDWGLALNNAIRGNWYKLWFQSNDDQAWYLTTAGKSRQALSQAEA